MSLLTASARFVTRRFRFRETETADSLFVAVRSADFASSAIPPSLSRELSALSVGETKRVNNLVGVGPLKVGRDSETLNAVYVTDAEHHLTDDIRMREILLTQPDARVRDRMNRQFVTLKVTDTEATAVEMFRKYDRTVLPIVDRRGVMLGVVTVDDVLDVAEETATREIQKFGGLEALDEAYATTPVLELVRKRGTWLIVLFAGEMLTASAMGFF